MLTGFHDASVLIAALSAAAFVPGGELASDRVAEAAHCVPKSARHQANTFTSSAQEAVAIDAGPRGAVLVWQSRRQQAGNYGIYARRTALDGVPFGPEVEVNQYTAGPQTAPCVALDAQGSAWFAWESLAQDGDAGGIFARRFDADLASSSVEILVNDITRGHQGEVALASDRAGHALVVWTSPASGASGSRELRARFLAADGGASGASFVLSAEGRATQPTVAVLADGSFAVAWSRADESGVPQSIRARRVAAFGRAPEEALASAEQALWEEGGRMPIEPVLARSGDRLALAWLVASGDDYVPHTASVAWSAESGRLELGAAHSFTAGGPGYTSGLALACDAQGGSNLAWSRYGGDAAEGDKEREKSARIWLVHVDADGHAGQPRALNDEERAGRECLRAGGGGQRAASWPDGRFALAWSGDFDCGDDSAAGLTMLLPEGVSFAQAAVAQTAPATRIEAESGAAPHEPPVFSGGATRREDFTDLKSLNGPDFGFLGITQTALTPPDVGMAAGPNHFVEIVNGAMAFFLRDGTFQSQVPIDGATGFWAPIGGTGFIFDPEVVFDPDSRRFFAMACERNGPSFFLLAVSDDDDPNGTWFKYRFNVTGAISDNDIDSPNMGVDGQAVYLTADFFGPDKYLTFIVQKAPLLTGGVPITTSLPHTGSQSWGIPVMYDAAPAFYMAETFETPVSNAIRLHAITNPLGVPVDTTFDLTVPSYEQPENPPQMGTSVRPETFEARVWSCVFRNGKFYVTHHTGATRILQRWYEIDMANWPVSGVPTLVQSGDVDPGPGIRSFFGSIGVDVQGNVGLTYARSGANEFISMARSYHLAGSPAGSTTPSVISKASSSADLSGRWGDYSSTVADPDFDRVFWGAHEFRTNIWSTWIAAFGPCDPPTTYCTAKQTSLGGLPSIGFSGEPSLGANNFQVTLSNAIPNAVGIYIHSANPAALPFFNGIRCVASPFLRSASTLTNAAGAASAPFPITAADVGRDRYVQFWFRDANQTDGTGVGLSNGLQLSFCP